MVLPKLSSIRLMQANVLMPPMFIEHEPQMPSRHERRNVSVGSISFLIFSNASSTIGAHSFRLTWYFCMYGFSVGLSGFQRYTSNVFMRGFFSGAAVSSAARGADTCSKRSYFGYRTKKKEETISNNDANVVKQTFDHHVL